MRALLVFLLAGGLVVGAALIGGPVLERNRWAGEMRQLRLQLNEARWAADSCKAALAREEEGFRAYDRVVDSLRNVVEGFEDPQQGGVPQADYDTYMEQFELYNRSVEEWRTRADRLQENEARCRALIEAHNALGDSIRRRQEERRTDRGGD